MIYLTWFVSLCLICGVVDRFKAYSDLKAKYDTMVIEKNAELKRVRDRLAESITETNEAVMRCAEYRTLTNDLRKVINRITNIVTGAE